MSMTTGEPEGPNDAVNVDVTTASTESGNGGADAAASASPEGADGQEAIHPLEAARLEQVAAYPYVALTIQSSGIHPTTSRLLTIDALTYDDHGDIGEEFHLIVDPEGDPGPRHQHGLSPEDFAAAQPFGKSLRALDRLIDGRTLVVHDAAYTWGFLVFEARHAMTAAARANRARSRNRNRSRRRRHKVGHVPQPVAIIDTLATARRQSVQLDDVRVPAVAAAYGITVPDMMSGTAAQAASRPEEITRANTQLVMNLELKARGGEGGIGKLDPENLRGDRFGLQRSHVRVDAADAPRPHPNPGPWKQGSKLRAGMEFTVAPEIAADPDEIIAAGVAAGLAYVEKLSRETSICVCNQREDLTGKAMHADRKDIPLVTDEEFLQLVQDVEEALADAPAPTRAPARAAHVPNANNRSTRRRTRRRSNQSVAKNVAKAGTKPNAKQGSKPGVKDSAKAEGSSAVTSANTAAPANGHGPAGGATPAGDGAPTKRKRRRGSRGGSRRRRGSSGSSGAGNASGNSAGPQSAN